MKKKMLIITTVSDSLPFFKGQITILKNSFDIELVSSRTDVSRLLKSVEISVVSSHWEGFGLAAVEGMAVGKPVIASNVEGLCGVVNGAGILFEKGNDKELANIVKELLSDIDYYNKVGKAGFERAKQYDINSMVDKQIQLYNELLK